MIIHKKSLVVLAAGLALAAGTPAAGARDASGHTTEQTANLEKFDDLDFLIYTGQRWDEFALSHADDIVVHYPDGSTTTGIDPHLDRLRPQFAFAPDSRIEDHPIRLADGNYTAVQGILRGTFSEPMTLGNGQVIEPTGKAFEIEMVTIGRWEDGKMAEEWLYWDNATFMQQIGL